LILRIYESEILMQTASQPSIVAPASVVTPSKENWPHVASFPGLTFGLTWLADGISQEKEKDFPIIWEVFLGDGYSDLSRAE
jgi:hypothetical protein